MQVGISNSLTASRIDTSGALLYCTSKEGVLGGGVVEGGGGVCTAGAAELPPPPPQPISNSVQSTAGIFIRIIIVLPII